MSEETILKSSIWGGYKKQDVMEYVDSVLEKKEKRAKIMEEQVSLLIRENKQIRNQMEIESKRPSKALKDNKELEMNKEYGNNPIPFPMMVTQTDEKQEKRNIRQQMELPEGTYLITKSNGVITLPDPSPSSHTKQKDIAMNSVALTQEEDYNKGFENKNEYSNTIEEQLWNETTIIGEIEKIKKIDKIDETIKIEKTEQSNHTEEILSTKIAELQEELTITKKMLENEKHEKLLLTAKLEYSYELFMQLYKSKK